MTDEQRAALARLRGNNAVGIGSDWQAWLTDWQVWLTNQLGTDVKPNVIADIIAAAELALAEHPADDGEPITKEWLKSLGFSDSGYSFIITGEKDYGEDVARFRLACNGDDWTDGNCSWEFHLRSIELEEQGGMLPCEPKTRGDLRRLCRALGIELKEGGE